MPPARLIAGAAFAFAMALAPAASAISVTAYRFDSSPVMSDGQGSLGFTFKTNAALCHDRCRIFRLGYYDDGVGGFLTPHEVGVFQGDGMSGPGPLLASTTVGSGSSPGPNSFRYSTIKGLPLQDGVSYTIAGLSPAAGANDPWVLGGPSETTGFRTALVWIGPDAGRFSFGSPTLVDPSQHVGDYNFYAVNFILGTPEPAAWAMMLAGLGMVGAVARSRRRHALAA
jgi:hypothetical protein